MTRCRGLAAEDDPALRDLVNCAAPVVTLRERPGRFTSTRARWTSRGEPGDDRRLGQLPAPRASAVYDAEHFFDAWREDRGYALECLRAAVAAGAENVTLCDTNGSTLPTQVAEATAAVVAELGERAGGRDPHAQRRECGVANSGWLLSRPEREWSRERSTGTASARNANLVSILPALQLKLGYDCAPADRCGC